MVISETETRTREVDTLPLDELRRRLPGASDEQLRQWQQLAERVKELLAIAKALPLNVEERATVNDALNKAWQLLNNAQTYAISLVGVTGAGKSTLINALLGRNLLASGSGGAITGTIISVHHIVPEGKKAQKDEARIYYHTSESLKAVVETLCKEVSHKPVYIENNPAKGINIDAMQRQLPNWGVVCSNVKCGHENQVGKKFCTECATPLEGLQVTLVQIQEALKDLFESCMRNPKLVGDVRKIPLDSVENIKLVQNMMSERSDINKGSGRIIPLIEHVEYDIVASPQTAQNNSGEDQSGETLVDTILTDIPGAAARVLMHERRLREQLVSTKTGAVILVMDPTRPETLTKETLRPITELLMGELKGEQRLSMAGHVFLVANDKNAGISPDPNKKKNARETIERIAEDIAPNYTRRYRENIFYDVMALPALIAELINTYPAEADAWLNRGEQTEHFAQFDSEYRDHGYKELRKRADERKIDVLEWSEIPRLRRVLNTFLGKTRFASELEAANALYSNAWRIVYDWIDGESGKLFSKPFSKEPPGALAHLREQKVRQLIERYRKQVRAEAKRVEELFEKACNNMREDEKKVPSLLDARFKIALADVRQQIGEYTTKADFKKNLRGEDIDKLYGGLFTASGMLKPLLDLDKFVVNLLEKQAESVAKAVQDAFLQELDHEHVEEALKKACHNQHGYEANLHVYREIVGSINTSYVDACRGAILYQTAQRDMKIEIAGRGDFGRIMKRKHDSVDKSEATGPSAKTVADRLVDTSIDSLVADIQRVWSETLATWALSLAQGLAIPYFYYLIKAEEGMMHMVSRLGDDLAFAISQDSPLFREFESAEKGLIDPEQLIDFWQQVQRLHA